MKTIFFMLLILCACIISCTTNYDAVSTGDTGNDAVQTTTELSGTISMVDSSGADPSIVYNGTNPVMDWDKKIIKTANIHANCKEYKPYNQQVHQLARQFGGWIAAESEAQTNNRINNTVSIKVPVAQFEDLLMAIGNLDANILEKRISTEDATGKIVDTKGRIAVKKEIRDKYLEMMKRHNNIEDALKVQDELNEIHEDLEMAAMHLQSLQHQTMYSTIHLNYYQVVDMPVVTPDDPGFAARMISAAAAGGAWVLDLFVGLVSIWPLLVAGIIITVFVRRKLNRNKQVMA